MILKIVWAIAGGKPTESAEPLLESLSIIKPDDINKYLITRFMYKFPIGMVTKLFSSYYKHYKKIIKYRHITFQMQTDIIYHPLLQILAGMG